MPNGEEVRSVSQQNVLPSAQGLEVKEPSSGHGRGVSLDIPFYRTGQVVVYPRRRPKGDYPWREAVLVMQVQVDLSQRRACGLMELYRATCRYRKRRSEDQSLRVRLRELAEARRRFLLDTQ